MHKRDLSLQTECFHIHNGRVMRAQLRDFVDLVNKAVEGGHMQNQHFLTHWEGMHYLAKWEGGERWICGFKDRASAEKKLQLVQAKEILANAQGHLYLTEIEAQRALQRENQDQFFNLRMA